jgi:hypothetical protein
MRAVLFHAIESARSRDGRNFGRLAKSSVKETAHCHRLADNVWLITEEDPLMSAGRLLALAQMHAISARTLEFDLEDQWKDHPAQG